MRLQDVLRAVKSDIKACDWASGKLPKARMPLSKAGRRAYAIGSAWRWRFVEFKALGESFVVRVLFCADKSTVYSHLALRVGTDSAVLCSLEFHPDLVTGWHAHGFCGDIAEAPRGTLAHGSWMKRVPGPRAFHRRTVLNDGASGGIEAWIWRQSMLFYRVESEGELL